MTAVEGHPVTYLMKTGTRRSCTQCRGYHERADFPRRIETVDWHRVSQHAVAALLGLCIAVFLLGAVAVLVTALDIR